MPAGLPCNPGDKIQFPHFCGKGETMKTELGMTDVVGLPIDEAEGIMEGMKQAEKTGDLEALRWCARMILWLWDQAAVSETDAYGYSENLFNGAWGSLMKTDPPPASIAAVVARKGGTMKIKEDLDVKFTDPPRIANRYDTLELLDVLIKADGVVNGFIALQALRDAVEQEIV
jgi:hypothetical protein